MAFFLLLLMVPLFASGFNRHEKPQCQCVPLNLCRDNDADVAVNGQGLLDIRQGLILKRVQNNVCANQFEVCCENPIFKSNLRNSTYRDCGYQNIELRSRITSNSGNAGFTELPWIVVVLLRDVIKPGRVWYKCGGSLIHPQIVLTAAHCVVQVNIERLTIRAGEWNTNSHNEPMPHEDNTVDEILIHPKFHNASLNNDIALLFLTSPFQLTVNIRPVCLPPLHLQLDNTVCKVGGWGKNTWKQGKYSPILKKVELPLVPKDKCVRALRKTRLGGFFKLHKSFICAGGENNKDTCKGDGGSPLVCPIPEEDNRYFQMGIVSWGIGCGENGIPGVYVNVPLFTTWIDNEVSARNFDTSFYKYD